MLRTSLDITYGTRVSFLGLVEKHRVEDEVGSRVRRGAARGIPLTRFAGVKCLVDVGTRRPSTREAFERAREDIDGRS